MRISYQYDGNATLPGLLKSDEQTKAEADGDMDLAASLGVPQLNVSYKPQKISVRSRHLI